MFLCNIVSGVCFYVILCYIVRGMYVTKMMSNAGTTVEAYLDTEVCVMVKLEDPHQLKRNPMRDQTHHLLLCSPHHAIELPPPGG